MGCKWRILIKCAVVDHALSDKLLYKQCILVKRLKSAQAFLSTKSVKELWIEEQIRPLTWGRCPTPYTTKFNTEFLLISPVSEMVSISFRGYPAQVTFPKIQTTSRIFSKMYSYIYKIIVVLQVTSSMITFAVYLQIHIIYLMVDLDRAYKL